VWPTTVICPAAAAALVEDWQGLLKILVSVLLLQLLKLPLQVAAGVLSGLVLLMLPRTGYGPSPCSA